MFKKITRFLNKHIDPMVWRSLTALIANILLVYLAYTLCRIVFIFQNHAIYSDLSFSHALELLRAGLVFDSSAIFYTNAIIILLFLLPLHFKERKGYFRVARWIYVIVNAICIIANLCDSVYFPFTGKRTTMSVFAEFSNEGAGNLSHVFIDQIVRNWWLVIVAALIIAMLWIGFRSPLKSLTAFSFRRSKPLPQASGIDKSHRRLWVYYPLMLALLCGFVYLSIGMMRGGFTHAVRPITISNANKYADSPAEAGIVLNTPFSIFRTLGKRVLVTPDYMPYEQAEALYSALHVPASDGDNATSEFRPMNVVILIVESLGKQHIGFYNDTHDENGPEGFKKSFTPFLDSLLASGDALSFRYSYANGRKSIEAMPPILSSIPNFVEPFFLTPASLNNLSGIARVLGDSKGYSSAFFHGAENGSMGFEAFANSTGFQRYYGRTEYAQDPRYDDARDFDGTWAIYDEEFLQYFADHISDLPAPFVATVFTASSHAPYSLPERYKDVFPKGEHPLQECLAYTDNALRLFFEKAKTQDWFDNTLFVITADHGASPVDRFYNTTLGTFAVPIVFYAPSVEGLSGYDTNTVVNHSDIMPTVLNFLGFDEPYVAFGQDILSTDASKKMAIHWVPEFQGYEYVRGDKLVRFESDTIMSAYDYRTDLLLEHNILSELSPALRDSLTLEIKAIVQQYMRCVNTNAMTPATYIPNP